MSEAGSSTDEQSSTTGAPLRRYYRIRPNFSRIPLITREVHSIIGAHDQWTQEELPPEFLDYYVTALLWARLLHLKRQYNVMPLHEREDDYLRYFVARVLTLPEPIYNILTMIGTVRLARLQHDMTVSDHALPIKMIGVRSGYHATLITPTNHILFEEVPSLGVSGDCIMSLASMGYAPVPHFPFLPVGAEATSNLAGYFGPGGMISERVRAVLRMLSISGDIFNESSIGTRLNIHLVDHVSTTIQQVRGIRLKNLCIGQMDTDGSETQVVKTYPTQAAMSPSQPWNLLVEPWTQRQVQPEIHNYSDAECVKASYYAGFQLYKVPVEDSHENWCCIKENGLGPWRLSDAYIMNRNSRRHFTTFLWGNITGRGNSRSQSDATREYCQEYVPPQDS